MGGIEPTRVDEALLDRLELGANTRLFFKRVYAGGLDKYARRLRALGFAGGERGLDAGCGGGQWSFALAGMCREVWGIDVSLERVDACTRIAEGMHKTNVHFVHGGLERLPFGRATFDRVLCYSVLNLVHYENAIEELARVTRPGGLVYINANGIGRYVHDIVHRRNPAPDFDPRRYSLLTLWNTLSGRRSGLSPRAGGVVAFRGRIGRLLADAGFAVMASGPEGTLLGGGEPFLAGSYAGLPSAFDVLARRES